MKRAIVITDISGLGNCSGSANIAVMSSLGIECCLIPTAVLSAQTGFSEYSYSDMSGTINEAADSLIRLSPSVDAVYVGFLANSGQCAAAETLVNHFREKGAVIVVDPITGDNGRRFAFLSGEEYEKIAALALDADIITPNLTELCLLTGENYERVFSLPEDERLDNIGRIAQSIMNERLKTVVVTGVECGGEFVTMTVTPNGVSKARTKRIGGSISGTGDVMTSIICAAAAKGKDISEAAAAAAKFIEDVLKNADIKDRNFGIPFQEHLSELIISFQE